MTAFLDLVPLQHPGLVAPTRVESVRGTTSVVRASLAPGRRLVDAIDEELHRLGADAAQVELLGGPLDRVSYCVPAVCDDGSRAAWYSETREAVVPATVVAGSATVGRRDGERFMHCHAIWFDADGDLAGGHLWPDTVIGPSPLEVVLHAFDVVALTSGVDDETRMPVFTPSLASEPPRDGHRAVMSRIRPGVEIHRAVGQVLSDSGFRRATVRGSLGSLVGATMSRDDGSASRADGPATEVTMAGHVDLDSGRPAQLTAFAVDRHGRVHVGELSARGNLVAVTFELLVEEVTP